MKNQPKRDKFKVPPKGVDQYLHVNQIWKVAKNAVFSNVILDFRPKSLKNIWNEQKGLKTALKKVFQPAFRCLQYMKAGLDPTNKKSQIQFFLEKSENFGG